MQNSFHQIEEAQLRDLKVPAEIELNVVSQLETFSFFSNVVELFIPNALQTVVRMIGGETAEEHKTVQKTTSPELGRSWAVRPPGGPGSR